MRREGWGHPRAGMARRGREESSQQAIKVNLSAEQLGVHGSWLWLGAQVTYHSLPAQGRSRSNAV